MRGRCFLGILLLAILTCGCLGPNRSLYPARTPTTIYVVHRGMHAGVVVPREEVPPHVWPAQAVAPQTKYLEIGWGDSEGYRFDWTTRIVVRALFWPTPSVLLVRGFDESVIEQFEDRAKEIIAVPVSDAGLARMCAYLQQQYRLDEQGQPIPLGDGFYVAHGSYHAFHNSNHWTAHALRTAGCPITPFWAITANNVMFQTRRFGRVIWRR